MNFIDFNSFNDIGFNPSGLRIEACSRFPFVTYNRKKKKYSINLILIDPHYDDIQIVLFRTDKRYYFTGGNGDKFNDIIIKSVMYTTGKEIKIV